MQRIAVFVVAPTGSLVHAWAARSFDVQASPSAASVVVFEPTCDAEARALGLPRVACLPVTDDDDLPMAPDAARHVGVRADAYASEASTLLAAVSHVASEPRDARTRGPLRWIWLGSLGERMPPTSPAIGAAIPIGERVQIGRSDDADIRLRQGPHSDQNTVARQHAVVERGPWGLRVRDLQSTNGTYVDGQRVAEANLHPGDEIAIAWTHRLRLDGESLRDSGR